MNMNFGNLLGNSKLDFIRKLWMLFSLLFYCNGIFNSIELAKLSYKLNNLRSVFEDNKNNIWLGTNDGVYIIDENFNLVQHLTTEDGISDNYIISICQDINGFIWLASYNNGISKIDISLKEIQIESFFKSDGLCSNKFCWNSNRCYITVNK